MATIGYYNMGESQGAAYQADVIGAIGQTGLNLSTLGSLGASQVVYLDNGSNSAYNSDFLANQANLMNFVSAGGVLVMHDRLADGSFFGGFSHNAGEPYGADVDFINDTGPVADGPGGTLTDFSLDHYDWSNHGVADIRAFQDGLYFVLATAQDPSKLVTVAQLIGAGELIYSSIPTDYWVGSESDASMTAYMQNLLQYAVDLQALTTQVLTASGDVFRGGNAAEKVFADDGADKLKSAGGDDLLYAGGGNDKVNAGAGDDLAWGGDGVDVLKGGAGNDQLWGGEKHDKLNGGTGDDFLVGGSGNDILRGADGDDTLLGADGNDRLDGGSAFDKLAGGAGSDTMTGGDSADIFFFGPDESPVSKPDVVTDFVHGQDLVDLTAYDISDWTIRTASTFSGVAHEILIYDGGGNTTMVKIDLDGDANADAVIELHSDSVANQADVTDVQYSFPV